MDRRNFIEISAAIAGTASLSGCTDRFISDDDDVDDETDSRFTLPEYSTWLPQDNLGQTSDGVVFSHIDVEWMERMSTDTEDVESPESKVGVDESSLGLAIYGGMMTPFTFFGLFGYPFIDEIVPSSEEDDDEHVEGIDTRSLTLVNNSFIFHGDYDPAAFADRYTENFDQVDERDGFQLFSGVASESGFAMMDSEGLAFAVSDDAVVVAMPVDEDDSEDDEPTDLMPRVETLLDAKLQEVTRIADTEDTAWSFDATGDQPIIYGFWGLDDGTENLSEMDDMASVDGEQGNTEEDFSETQYLSMAESVVSGVDIQHNDAGQIERIESDMALVFPDFPPTEDEIHSDIVGSDEIDADITVEENRVHVNGVVTYDV